MAGDVVGVPIRTRVIGNYRRPGDQGYVPERLDHDEVVTPYAQRGECAWAFSARLGRDIHIVRWEATDAR